MLRQLHIGPAVLQTSLLIYLLGFYFAVEAARRNARRHDLDGQTVQNALMLGFLVGLGGARIVYGIQHWSVYRSDIGAWVSLTPQGLSVPGGLLVAILAITLFVIRRGISLRAFLETIAPGLGVMMVALALGLAADGAAFGQASQLPWAIDLWAEDRHPTQFYAALGSLLTLLLWWRYRKNLETPLVLAGNALTWVAVGFLLAEPVLVLGNYRLVQVAGWLGLMLAAFAWNRWDQKAEG